MNIKTDKMPVLGIGNILSITIDDEMGNVSSMNLTKEAYTQISQHMNETLAADQVVPSTSNDESQQG